MDTPNFLLGVTAVAVDFPSHLAAWKAWRVGKLIWPACISGSWRQRTEVIPANPHLCGPVALRPSPYPPLHYVLASSATPCEREIASDSLENYL